MELPCCYGTDALATSRPDSLMFRKAQSSCPTQLRRKTLVCVQVDHSHADSHKSLSRRCVICSCVRAALQWSSRPAFLDCNHRSYLGRLRTHTTSRLCPYLSCSPSPAYDTLFTEPLSCDICQRVASTSPSSLALHLSLSSPACC